MIINCMIEENSKYHINNLCLIFYLLPSTPAAYRKRLCVCVRFKIITEHNNMNYGRVAGVEK